MTEDQAGQDRTTPGRSSLAGRMVFSPVIWGCAATWIFYQAIPFSPIAADLLQRYFCAHPLEYVTATLFFVGMTILVMRATTRCRDSIAARNLVFSDELDTLLEPGGGSLARASLLREHSANWPDCGRGRRLTVLCTFVTRRGSGAGVSEHGRFLADQASEQLHESYSLVRTITWAVPILGFLGTVVGITMAIANVTPEQLDTSLGEVTDGLAVAFDTTALALTLSLVLVFASNAIQRLEQASLAKIESWSLREVAPLLGESEGVGGRLRDAEQQAARQLLAESDAAIRRQADLWDQSLETLRERWVETLERQTTEFEATLGQGLEQGLADHDRKLDAFREEWLNACREVTDGLVSQTGRLADSLSGGVGECVTAINQSTEAVRDQLGQLQHQGELLLRVIEREEELAGLEARLVENLEAVRTAEAFEQALISLTAAANLMSARAGSKAA
ncbi:MAG: MotA/TolQ/ExbB proton channel family protein [Planctomycetota bacterium]|nr:MotA/TolQ/ExbB proton channel family protein [Planctomycetota bacterium]